MKVLESLPSRPLAPSDVKRLRDHETINGFIQLGSHEHTLKNGGVERAVVRIERTVVSLSFENGRWERAVLERDADDQDHLDEALKQLSQQ